jgi:hypothetical protein
MKSQSANVDDTAPATDKMVPFAAKLDDVIGVNASVRVGEGGPPPGRHTRARPGLNEPAVIHPRPFISML